jgi:hypothetical protein
MRLKTRISKLERVNLPSHSVCLLIKYNDQLTLEQQKQFAQAKAEKRQVIIVSFGK